MNHLRQSAAVALTLALCFAGGSAVNAGQPLQPKAVPAKKNIPAHRPPVSSVAPTPPSTRVSPAPTTNPDDGSRGELSNAPAPSPPPGVDSTVGALFTMGENGLGDHFCSASVVHSTRRNLVITAAHCLHSGLDGDYGSNIVFVPGYHDGVTPYGIWPADRLTVDPKWIDSADPDVDVGFLNVSQPGNPKPIEDVTGGNELTLGAGFSLPVTIIGYPNDTDEPLTCSNTTSQQSTYQLRLACAGFTPGTSGSPWLIDIDRQTHRGGLVGVIGGYQQGGDDPDISYSSYFDEEINRLYRAASQSG